MPVTIAIIDYGMGNIYSIYKKLDLLNVKPIVATTPQEILNADKIILPGVGHFQKACANLKDTKVFDIINEVVLVKKVPILGICLGMQLMANRSEEGNAVGFGWFNSNVTRFKVEDKIKYKVPHIGWNTVEPGKYNTLFKSITAKSEFYFNHCYHYELTGPIEAIAMTEYEYGFVSAIERENIFGTQFHPEKSHNSGTQLLQNFIQI